VSSTVEEDCGRPKTPLLLLLKVRAVRRNSGRADLSFEDAGCWLLVVVLLVLENRPKPTMPERDDEAEDEAEDDDDDFCLAETLEDLDLREGEEEVEELEDFFVRFFRVLIFLVPTPPTESLVELASGTGCRRSAARRLLRGDAT
jgi:hypothetical protein